MCYCPFIHHRTKESTMNSLRVTMLTCAAILLVSFGATAQWINGQAADVVLGQQDSPPGSTMIPPTANAIQSPYGVAIDPTTGKLFVADAMNHRVLRWSST